MRREMEISLARSARAKGLGGWEAGMKTLLRSE